MGWWLKKMGCVWLISSTPGCGYSNSGSNPSILPNLVHIVKSWDGLWDPRNRLKKSLYSLFPIFNTDCFFSGPQLYVWYEICICIALKDCVLEPIIFIFLFTANLSLVLLIYLYSTVFTELSAAPQTTLGRGPGSRFEPGTGGSTVVAGTLTTWPPHLANF